LEVALGIDIAVLAQNVDSGDPNIVEAQDCIINAVDADFDAHVTAIDTLL